MANIVAAIDLGTSRSAYSFTHLSNDGGVGDSVHKPEVHLGIPGNLQDSNHALERKTATSLLLARADDHQHGWCLKTFGDKAEHEYIEEKENGRGGDFALFKYFKMELFKGGREKREGRTIDNAEAVATDNRVRLPLVYIFTLALEHMKKAILERLNKMDRITLSPNDIHWVVTIPAIWSAFGKAFMRAAAFRAGLIEVENDQKKLRLCLEPEAACLSVDHHNFHPWEEGTEFMVLDCGGGTIDITFHHVEQVTPLALKELEEPGGRPWGSTVIDSKFKDFLKALLDCDDYTWKTLLNTTHMLELMKNWEDKKTEYKKGDTVRLSLGDILPEIEMNARDLASMVQKCEKGGVEAKGNRLIVRPELMESFFGEPLGEIARVTGEMLLKHPRISLVYMVGGFSCSTLLQDDIKAGLPQGRGHVRVVTPQRPGLAIVVGAALFGARDTSIVSRKARLTYGVKSHQAFDESDGAHQQRAFRTINYEDRPFFQVFEPYVERGDDLPVGSDRERNFYPVADKSSSISFKILMSKRKAAEIKYLDDAGVDRMVHDVIAVDVPLDMTVPQPRRGVSSRLSFGGTELSIKCTRLSDGKVITASTIFVDHVDG